MDIANLSSPMPSLSSAALTVLMAFFVLPGCSAPGPHPIHASEEVLEQAHEVGFDYRQVLVRAQGGDEAALASLMRFSFETDAAGALGHGVVMLGLLQQLGDDAFAAEARRRSQLVVRRSGEALLAGKAYIYPRMHASLCDTYPKTCAVVFGENRPEEPEPLPDEFPSPYSDDADSWAHGDGAETRTP